MSEQSVNTGAISTPVEASTHTVTVEQGIPHSGGEKQSEPLTGLRGSNHDRLQAAYAKATGGETLTNEPLTVEKLADFQLPDGDHKGIDYNATIKALPEDAQKILANLRADYTKKTQALATSQKELTEQRQALLESQMFKDMEAKANEPRVEADPWDPVAFNQRIEQEVAKRMSEVFKPMKEEIEIQQRRNKLQEFKTANPDLETYKTEIVEVLKTNESLNLEQAYYIVKGKNQTESLRAKEQELAAYKSAAKEYGLKVGIGSANSGPLAPPASVKRDAYSIYRWLQANQKA